MIRTKQEYHGALETRRGLLAGLDAQRAEFTGLGLAPAEVERALQPMLGFLGQIEAELAQYDQWCQGQIDPVTDIAQVGQLLIALRIARGWTQRELAARLGVSEAQVSRDERNEYHAITPERVDRILKALGARIVVNVETPLAPPASRELVGAP